MVAAQIDDFGATFSEFLEDEAYEAGVLLGPAPLACEAPAIDDIAVEDELLTVSVLEEVVYFVDLAVERTKVHIGQDDRLKTEGCFLHGWQNSIWWGIKRRQAGRVKSLCYKPAICYLYGMIL